MLGENSNEQGGKKTFARRGLTSVLRSEQRAGPLHKVVVWVHSHYHFHIVFKISEKKIEGIGGRPGGEGRSDR